MPCTRSPTWPYPPRLVQGRSAGGSRRRSIPGPASVRRRSALGARDTPATAMRAQALACVRAAAAALRSRLHGIFDTRQQDFPTTAQPHPVKRAPVPSSTAHRTMSGGAAEGGPGLSSSAPMVDPCNLWHVGPEVLLSEECDCGFSSREYIGQRLVENDRGALPRRAVLPVVVSGIHRCATCNIPNESSLWCGGFKRRCPSGRYWAEISRQ